MMTKARDVLGAAMIIAAVLTTVACQTADPAPTSSTADYTLEPLRSDVAFDDAEAAYRNYVGMYDQVAQDYYRGWREKILPLESESTQESAAAFFTEGETGGYHQVGDTVIDSLDYWRYEEDDPATGRETVELRVCVDSTGVQELTPEGEDTLGEGTAARFFHVVTMKHEPGLDGDGAPLPDADDPYGQSWWRGAGSTTRYETC